MAAFALALPASAQELSVERAAPLDGELLVHSGRFAAERSTAEQGIPCRGDDIEAREQTSFVLFDPPFEDTPQVFVSLDGFDFGWNRNARFSARAENVDRYAMTLVISTWCDTNMFVARGSYFAIGEPLQVIESEAEEDWLTGREEDWLIE